MYLDKGRQPVGVHTLTQLIIAASAVLVVGGIIVLTVISSFGETTDGRNWFAKFSQDEKQSKSSPAVIEEATQFTDEELIETMKMVQDLVVQYHRKTGRLPAMTGHLSLVTQSIPFEYPASGNQEPTIDGVHYESMGGNLFDLCANFTSSNKGMLAEEEALWEHAAGKVCFRRDIAVLVSLPIPTLDNTPTVPAQQSPAVSAGVSITDFFENTNTCTISSFTSREDNEHSPILTREIGIVHRVWTGEILGIQGTECIVELGYSDLSASDISLRSSALICRVDKDVFHATGTNRTIGSILTEKIANRSAIDLIGALDAVLNNSNLDEAEKTQLREMRETYIPITRAVDRPGVVCTVANSAF